MGHFGRQVAVVLVGLTASAAAQNTPPGTPAAPQPPPPQPGPVAPAVDPAAAPAVPTTPPAPADAAWTSYDQAFARLGSGDEEGARTELEAIRAAWPHHRAAQLASLRLVDLDTGARRRLELEANGPSKLARGELVFWSTLGGVMLATNLCVDNCTSDREFAAAYTLTVGGTLALSVLASRDGVHRGEAQLYNSAQTWGSWNALALNDGFAEDEREAAVSIGAQAGGLAAGIGLWQTWRPTAGDVALTNTGFLWTTVLTLWGHLAADSEPTLRRVVIAGDIGIVAGALASTQIKMSRGRTLLIDLGGVLGIMGGGLIALGTESDQGAGTSLLVGNVLGLGIAAVATREWDADVLPANARVVPTRMPDGQGFGLGIAFDR